MAETSNFNRPLKDYSQYVGQKFGKVTMLELLPREKCTDGRRTKAQECKARCDCGTVFCTRVTPLLNGNTQSCGCSRKQPHKYKPRQAERIDERPAPSVIAARVKAKYTCPYPTEACAISSITHLCCCECDRRDKCRYTVCQNTPERCGAKWRK